MIKSLIQSEIKNLSVKIPHHSKVHNVCLVYLKREATCFRVSHAHEDGEGNSNTF